MQWNLKRKRLESGETQEELAKLLNINRNTYADKENGKAKFDSDEMFILAKHFNSKLDDLFLPIKYTERKHEEIV